METYINDSIAYLKSNPHFTSIIEKWISYGDSMNFQVHTSNKYPPLIFSLQDMIYSGNITLKEDVILNRETSFPNTTIPTITSVTTYSETTGSYGDKLYPILVPKGTRLFFVTAADLICKTPIPFEETEQEFILEMGTYQLIDDKLVYTPK